MQSHGYTKVLMLILNCFISEKLNRKNTIFQILSAFSFGVLLYTLTDLFI